MRSEVEQFNNRRRGAFWGLACGDALGTTLEFKSPGTFEPIDDMAGGGPFGLEPGQWTDDTSMALCLAESLVNRAGMDARDQMERYVRWWRYGRWSATDRCFDIGNTVRSALERFERSGDPYSGSQEPHTAGNGSIMRLAPVPIFYARDLDSVFEYSGDSSLTTHAAAEAVDACRYFGLLIALAFTHSSKDAIFTAADEKFRERMRGFDPSSAILTIAAGSFREKEPPAIRGTGYVVASLEAALWAFAQSSTFREGALLAVNLGDDADTTGAVYGQIAGAFYGLDNIPEDWRHQLARRAEIESLLTHLLIASESR